MSASAEQPSDERTIFVAGDSRGANGDASDVELLVRAYSSAEGKVLWETVVEAPPGFVSVGPAFTSPVALDRGRLLLAGIASDDFSNQDLVVWAFDTRSGQLLWQDHVADSGPFDEPWSLATLGGLVFLGGYIGDCQVVRAYESGTGELMREDRFGGDGFVAFPAAHDDRWSSHRSAAYPTAT